MHIQVRTVGILFFLIGFTIAVITNTAWLGITVGLVSYVLIVGDSD